MKLALIGMFFALASTFAAPAVAAAPRMPAPTAVAPDDDDTDNAPADVPDDDSMDAPSRPGGNTHFSRGGIVLHKDDTDEDGPGAQALDDALDAAGGQHPGH
ncbi:MAG: hypothetical protein ACRC20_11755 [Segniliparus sp.]|uniref:hypothetical protein n=1 Tax=Segniliparus sp. TaxID=2804064 RepID=UPI003F3C82EC